VSVYSPYDLDALQCSLDALQCSLDALQCSLDALQCSLDVLQCSLHKIEKFERNVTFQNSAIVLSFGVPHKLTVLLFALLKQTKNKNVHVYPNSDKLSLLTDMT
jgi:hypothetical protein